MSEFQNLLQEELKDPEFKKEWDDTKTNNTPLWYVPSAAI